FLVSRGLWLLVLELTVVRGGLLFDVQNFDKYHIVFTLWALGWSMIALALLVHLPTRFIGAFGIAMIALDNLFDRFHVAPWKSGMADPGIGHKLAIFLHQAGGIPVFGASVIMVYPAVPWIGVMAAGYAFGRLYALDVPARRRSLLQLGVAVSLLFVVLRAANLYGDPSPWSTQKNAMFTVMSFLNLTKYPPSLLYLCMTLGPAILLLAVVEGRERGPLGRALIIFGRVPLFFYLLQFNVAHLLALAAFAVAGKPLAVLFFSIADTPKSIIDQSGFSLGVTYVFWIVGLVLLYPACVWFAGVKRRRRDWWLSYL
ncbi:MAG TPA: hypothetical protein VK636_09315, partial [Gemmatimonadaceae bacterium]|nr:hypothetical protein [Gemmatimonadaceae bacterium]